MEDRFGLLVRDTNVRDWIAGEFSPLGTSVTNPTGDWSIYLPDEETQNRSGFDRQACVSYSILNCLEVLHKAQTGIGINWSDRYVARMSNTTRNGNYLDAVFDAIRNYGLVEEWQYPDDVKTWEEYYQDIPEALQLEGKEILKKWGFYREWVRTDRKDDIFNALKSAPLQVTVKYASGNGLLNPTGQHNHAVMLFNASYGDYWELFDHYTQVRKKYAWDYEFGAVLKPSLIKKNNNFMFTPQDNTLYLLVQGPEQILTMGLNGKLIKYDEKIDALINSASRSKKYQIPVPITMEQYNSCEKLDGKGNKIA